MSGTAPVFPSDQDASGRQLGEEEILALATAIRSGTLTSTKGKFVKDFQSAFAKMVGAEFGYACSSGTAAIHAAVSAVDPEPGDEIITSPVTDMGAITPILYQTAIPVFADVDPVTGNLTLAGIEAAISDKTRAIIVTHLFGYPAEIEAICALAQERGIVVIEDCAQAYGATYKGRAIGTFGDIGCFSLQQGKHITTGEGGLVISNDDALARRLRLFIDKAWGYGDAKPDHYFVALNGRMTELQGAVALAQLNKLDHSVAQRQSLASKLTAGIGKIPGLVAPPDSPERSHSYWKYPLIVSPEVGGPVGFGQELRGFGINSAPRYIQKPAFECEVIRDQRTFGNSRFPFNLARPEAVDYAPERFSGTYQFLRDILVLPFNERYDVTHVDYLADRIRTICTRPASLDAAE